MKHGPNAKGQGYRVDHPNRGAKREAVYTVAPEVRMALAGNY
jgi:hypothetical protein